MPNHVVEIAGMKFGRRLVLSRAGKRHGQITWNFRCDCGNEGIARGSDLRNPDTPGCRKCGKVRHGNSGPNPTPEYNSWCGIIGRCENPSNPKYYRYGGRGITVCERWRASFEDFLSDMGPRPKQTSIERKNNDGNYEPSNCKWGTTIEQSRNRSFSKRVIYGGREMTLSEVIEISGTKFDYKLVNGRLLKGWPIQRALNEERWQRVQK